MLLLVSARKHGLLISKERMVGHSIHNCEIMDDNLYLYLTASQFKHQFYYTTAIMNRLFILVLLFAALLVIFTQESEGYLVSLTKNHTRKRYMRRMNRRLNRELQSNDSFRKKTEYFQKWLRKFERKVSYSILFCIYYIKPNISSFAKTSFT